MPSFLLRQSKVSCRHEILKILFFSFMSNVIYSFENELRIRGNFLSLENYWYIYMEIRVSNTHQEGANYRS